MGGGKGGGAKVDTGVRIIADNYGGKAVLWPHL